MNDTVLESFFRKAIAREAERDPTAIKCLSSP